MTQFLPGSEVKVLDTSNGSTLDAVFRRSLGQRKVEVYVLKWKSMFTFYDGVTKLGRFKLQGWGQE